MSTWYRLVPTSHVSRMAVKAVQRAASEFSPDAYAVELDAQRLASLQGGVRGKASFSVARNIGYKAYAFALIGAFLQRLLGAKFNLVPGSDMLAAVKIARSQEQPVLLVDQPLQRTLQRLNKALGWREAWQALKDTVKSLLGREKVTVTFSLHGVPSRAVVEQLLELFKERYPRPYTVLVEERNAFIARALQTYHSLNPEQKVLVVIGAAHEPGLQSLLEDKV